jgi:predicted methyltransferase
LHRIEGCRVNPLAGISSFLAHLVLDFLQIVKDVQFLLQFTGEGRKICFQIADELACLAAIISRPGLRTKCTRGGEEIINGRQIPVEAEILCAACAGVGYYRKKINIDKIPTEAPKHSVTFGLS